jgi:hypothetical protein
MLNLGFLLFAGCLLLGHVLVGLSFDALVSYQFREEHEAWIKDGRPNGMFWRPRDQTSYTSARGTVLARWIWSSPSWIERSPAWLRHRLLVFRLSVALWGILAIAAVCLMYSSLSKWMIEV